MTARERRLQELYRISEAEHAQILAHQGNVCAISGLPSSHYGTDHCHKTGLVRGIIDWRLNRALAFFKDDSALLRAAADYLDNPPAVTALGAPRYGLIGRAKQGKKNPKYGPPTKNAESEQ